MALGLVHLLFLIQAAALAPPVSLSFRTLYFYESPQVAIVPVFVQIGHGFVTLRKDGEKWIGRARVTGTASTADGTAASSFNGEIRLDLGNDEANGFQNKDLVFRNFLRLKPGSYRVKLSVADEKGGAGAAEQDLTIPDFSESDLTASSLVISQETIPLPAPGDDAKTQAPKPADPMQFRGFQVYAPVEADLDSKQPVLVFYRLYFAPDIASSRTFKVRAQARDEGGTIHEFPPVDATSFAVPAGETATAIGFLLPCADLKPGRYHLTVETAPGGGGRATTIAADFRMRGSDTDAESADLPPEAESTAPSNTFDDNLWSPPDFNRAASQFMPGPTCPLPEVLAGAAGRVEELIRDVDSFTATEVVEHREANRKGVFGSRDVRKFAYMVSIQKARGGRLNVEEFRDRDFSANKLPGQMATIGMPSLVMIFHPSYVGDFDLVCEGLIDWEGQPSWQVRFEQRKDRPSNLRSFRIDGARFDVRLKGRAWIKADTYQIVRLESHLAEPLPQIRLRAEHMKIDYQPVDFVERKVKLWLPRAAELYLDLAGHRYRRRHTFSDFKLFSVETKEEVASPKPRDPAP